MNEKEKLDMKLVEMQDDSLPPAATGERPHVSAHEKEIVQRDLQTAIHNVRKNKNAGSAADQLSRLVLDLEEDKISANEARRLLEAIMRSVNMKAQRSSALTSSSHAKAALIIGSIVLVASASLLMIQRLNTPSPNTTPTRAATATSYEWLTPPVSRERALKSLNSDVASSFRLTNNTNSPVDVYWLDFGGDRVKYMSIDPQQSRTQLTFATHPWVVVDGSGKAIKLFVAGSGKRKLEVK
jgi:hypothetical protein